MSIIIRPVETIEDCAAIERLQAEIWGDDIGVTPVHLLFTMAKEGGVVLLALEDDYPVGFAYGFPALTADNRLKFASHQAGVLPTLQDRGVGYQIKLAQREATLRKNIRLMTWTFDPLQGRNARLNLRKLGVVCRTYYPNLYGMMSDDLNQGLPSDRFSVDWWLDSNHVNQRLTGQAAEPDASAYPVLNPATLDENQLLTPASRVHSPTGASCLVEIPADIAVTKAADSDAALQWRLQTREIFETAFAAGYTVIDLLVHEGRNYYLLEKGWKLNDR